MSGRTQRSTHSRCSGSSFESHEPGSVSACVSDESKYRRHAPISSDTDCSMPAKFGSFASEVIAPHTAEVIQEGSGFGASTTEPDEAARKKRHSSGFTCREKAGGRVPRDHRP